MAWSSASGAGYQRLFGQWPEGCLRTERTTPLPKAGMHGFTKALALEVARNGVTVNTISPGYIGAKMVMAIPQEILDSKILPQIPVSRLGKPEEIAGLVAYLSSEEARVRDRCEHLDQWWSAHVLISLRAIADGSPRRSERRRGIPSGVFVLCVLSLSVPRSAGKTRAPCMTRIRVGRRSFWTTFWDGLTFAVAARGRRFGSPRP